MPLSPGTRLGTYVILSPLGAGGMGEVYRARDTRLLREVAVKVLPEAVVSRPDRLARFEREARAVAGLNHPNIVTLHSIEEEDGVRFLTMELIEGQGLDRLITPDGLPFPLVLDLSIPLAEALVAAHGKAIVHRDLKPANVMVSSEGRVKVLDFGLAKTALEPPRPEDATRTAMDEARISFEGQIVGTVPYMAPEQVRGEAADPRTDLFALGSILYELVTGRRPFPGATPADVCAAILRDEPVPVEWVRAHLPRGLARIIGHCLEKDRDQRFQSARDDLEELILVRRDMALGAPAPAPAPPAAPPAEHDSSIAVLPFVNRSHDEEDEYFSDGLADELLNVLAKIRGLRVAGRTSSFQFKGRNEDLRVIGRKLNVATLLEGSVRRSGSRVRIAVQLVKAANGYHIWSETYDRTLEDIFAVQDDIAHSVVKELRATLLGGVDDSGASAVVTAEVAAASRGRGESGEAHRLYLQGRYFVDRGSREDTIRGIRHLREALEMDPNHALAWAELSRGYMNEANGGWGPVAEAYERAREAAERALGLEPDLAEGHARLGGIRKNHDWDWKGAEASYRRALELAPGNAVVLDGAGVLAESLGRIEEAIELLRRAVEQEPLNSASYSNLGLAYHGADRLAEAEAACRKAQELAPRRICTRSHLALILLDQGRSEEALAEAIQEPEEVFRLLALAVIHHAGGRGAESDEALGGLIEKHSQDWAFQIAEVYGARGEVEEAFAWLERAYEQRDPGFAYMIPDRMLHSLHGDPRWAGLLRKVGFEA